MRQVLITGSSSGFGHDLVGLFLRRGYRVIATLRNASSRRDIFSNELSKYPDKLLIRELDVTRAVDRQALVKEFGELDILINNAGFGLYGAFEDMSETQIRDQFEVNFFSVLNLTHDFLPALKKRSGRVIVLSSAAGYIGVPFGSLYGASKFALEGWAESLWYELKTQGIHITLVEPGQFRTSFSQNMKYAEHFSDPFSPYFKMSKAFKQFREDRSQKRGVPSDKVLKTILSVAEMPWPPLRLRCGTDARLGFWLKWLLPERLFLGLLKSVFSKVYLGK